MKQSRFTEAQIISILAEQAHGAATADVCRHHGIRQMTFDKWKSKFGGVDVSDARRLDPEFSSLLCQISNYWVYSM